MARLLNFVIAAAVVVVVVLVCVSASSSNQVDNGDKTTNNFVQESIVRAHQELTTRLYKVFARKDSGNLILSPWSVMSLLTVTYIVAGGRTANEIGDHLHINLLRRKEILAGFEALNDIFKSAENGTAESLESWNGAFVGESVHPRHRLQKILQENLNTYIDHLVTSDNADNNTDSNATTMERDDFKELLMKKTHGLIQSVLPPSVGNAMAVWLFNIMHFQGAWQTPFNPHYTHIAKFMADGRRAVSVPTMASKAMYPRSRYPALGMRLLELPYGQSRRFALFILLPDHADGLPRLERRLRQFNLESMLSEDHWVRRAKVYLPKFKFQTDVSLMKVMKKLGFKRMFNPKFADFSRLDPNKKKKQKQKSRGSQDGAGQSPYVTQMVHKAVIEVSENGTRAAAASTLRLTSRRYTETFRINHPFMFVLRDRNLGINLFVGRVTDPTSLS
ncbi:serine protease inhibitor 42Dd-like isoform X2 [Littorina saxatilis]|uniref:Serpin domain-containing protein n=1 Tax=Littorina saxatilis TaxID=31220 RepID=A0AAN9ANU3_9CAEN